MENAASEVVMVVDTVSVLRSSGGGGLLFEVVQMDELSKEITVVGFHEQA